MQGYESFGRYIRNFSIADGIKLAANPTQLPKSSICPRVNAKRQLAQYASITITQDNSNMDTITSKDGTATSRVIYNPVGLATSTPSDGDLFCKPNPEIIFAKGEIPYDS
jgi:hypothetical protein